jgi:hypothetical protein
MEQYQPISREQSGRVTGGQVVPQHSADVVRRSHREAAVPAPVSRSSDLTERDRHYRAGATLDGGGNLVNIATDRILKSDRRLQEAAADGASPMALAAIERLQMTYGVGAGNLVDDFMNHPYERW